MTDRGWRARSVLLTLLVFAGFVAQAQENLGTVGFDENNLTVSESDGFVQLWVSYRGEVGEIPENLKINISTTSTTATDFKLEPEGSDYIGVDFYFFLFDDTAFSIIIGITDDDIPEPTETVIVELSTSSNVILSPQTAIITILDDDVVGVVGFLDDNLTVSESAGFVSLFVSYESQVDITESVQVSLSTISDTALDGLDYNGVNHDITLDNDVVGIDIVINDDLIDEPNESFIVSLAASGSSFPVIFSTQRAIVTILDDDVVNCGPLSDPLNGKVYVSQTTFGGIATYTCDPGYILTGTITRTCQSNQMWSGMAPTCTKEVPDCDGNYDCCEIKKIAPSETTHVFTIWDIVGTKQSHFSYVHTCTELSVRCDMETDGGGWIVIQRRIVDGTVNFTRKWTEYVNGFGDLDGEFWYGLDNIHYLTTRGDVELLIEVVIESDGSKLSLTYPTFSVAGAEDNYRLNIDLGVESGRDAMSFHNGQQFSTYDNDNDQSVGNCAYNYQGGWWYNVCYRANLNGPHDVPSNPSLDVYAQMVWIDADTDFNRVSSSQMMIRPKQCTL